jgi:hypothetical protein
MGVVKPVALNIRLLKKGSVHDFQKESAKDQQMHDSV